MLEEYTQALGGLLEVFERSVLRMIFSVAQKNHERDALFSEPSILKVAKTGRTHFYFSKQQRGTGSGSTGATSEANEGQKTSFPI